MVVWLEHDKIRTQFTGQMLLRQLKFRRNFAAGKLAVKLDKKIGS